MKRVGFLFEQIYNMDNLKKAFYNAKKGKGWYKEVRIIEQDLDEYLLELQEMLKNGEFKTSQYEKFTKKEYNKIREIYKLPFYPDRIAQWAIIQIIEPYLLKTFTQDTYSSIPHIGIHKALTKLQKALKNDPYNTTYCLKIDVKHFYQNINHDILIQKFNRVFKDKKLLNLIEEIINSINTANLKELQQFYGIKEQYPNTGIPIGNYLSQYCGNLYLSEFDHNIKENFNIKYYFRYMDDIVILSNSKKTLHKIFTEIKEYFKKDLKLIIKSNYQIFPVDKRGIDFVGYRVFPKFTLLRKTTCQKFKTVMKKIKRKVQLNPLITSRNWGQINSYNGWLRYCDSYRLKKKYFDELQPYSKLYYYKIIRGENNANLQEYLVS